MEDDLAQKGKVAVSDNFKKLQIVYIPLRNLKPNDYNPNRLKDEDFELLIRSMEEDGFTQPIIVTQENVIVDGEHRWRAAHTLGLHEVPAVVVDMNPEHMRVATIRHNRARGTHDLDLEAALLHDLAELGDIDWVLDSLMLEPEALDDLIQDMDEDIGEIELDIAMADGALVPMSGDYTFEVDAYPLVPEQEDDLSLGYGDLGPLVQEQGPPKAVYRITLGYTHGDAALIRAALGGHPMPQVTRIVRRSL